MKTHFTTSLRGRALWPGLSVVPFSLLLAAATAKGQTPYTGTGSISQVLAPAIICPNAAGQVLIRADIPILRVQSTDARLTGKRIVLSNGHLQPDGSAALYGTGYFEVGTWAGTNFTPSGGMWEVNWRGVMQTNYAMQLSLAGYGSGGTIDGLRMEETLTRGPASSGDDPAVPTFHTGTIKPAPVNTRDVVDNFDDNKLTDWIWGGSGTQLPLIESNQQFAVRGKWPGLVTRLHIDTWNWPYVYKNWSVANNRTLECRVDLVSMSENATNAAGVVFWNWNEYHSYALFKGRDYVQVGKWVGGGTHGLAVFFHEQVAIKNTNVVLSLALTRVDPNVTLTARVLDKDNQEAVLYQRSVVDTPGIDRTLTTAELRAVSGMNLSTFPDYGPPLTSGDAILLTAFQYTDGTQPELAVTYDNLELRTSEIPPLGIERAVRLSWPALGTINYAVQGAPSVQGPWLPVQDTTIPGMNQMTVPANDPSRIFRLIQAP